ncbi:MAG TPA: DEAD/DEAH box helicase [Fibrobacteria bacterium]|nr:DEAD/DEAH box helicase [Fibrobacteria bacterium]
MPEYVLKTPAYPHQLDALDFAYGKAYFGLFLPPGLGKTKIVIDLAATYWKEGRIDAMLYIGPNGVQRQTLEEQFPQHCAVPFVPHLFVTGNSKSHERAVTRFFKTPREEGLKVFAANVESFSYDTYLPLFKMFLKMFKTFLVVDEGQALANPSANRTRNITYALGDMTMAGKRIVDVKPLSVCRAVLTGTPVTNSPFSVWSMAEFMRHNIFGLTYSAFCARYGLQRTDYVPRTAKQFRRSLSLQEMQRIRTNHAKGIAPASTCAYFAISNDDYLYIVDHPDIQVPYKNLPELKETLRRFAFTRRKEDCLSLPPKIYTNLKVDMTAEQRAAYNSLAKDLIAEYGGKELSVVNKISLVTRLSQIAGGFFPGNDGEPASPIGKNPKIAALLTDLEDVQDYPVIVLTRFVAEAKAVADALRSAYPELCTELIYGDIPTEERSGILERFKAGEVQFLVATIRTIGVGFNLQKAALTYYFSNSYSLVDREQSEDRTHRVGQEAESVVYKDILARDTIDERVYDVLYGKKDLAAYMQDMTLEDFIGGKK